MLGTGRGRGRGREGEWEWVGKGEEVRWVEVWEVRAIGDGGSREGDGYVGKG